MRKRGEIKSTTYLLQREPRLYGLDETVFAVNVAMAIAVFLALPGFLWFLAVVFAAVQHGVLVRLSREDPRDPLKLVRFAFSEKRFGYPTYEELLPWMMRRLFSPA